MIIKHVISKCIKLTKNKDLEMAKKYALALNSVLSLKKSSLNSFYALSHKITI